jgi:hypothetical protein
VTAHKWEKSDSSDSDDEKTALFVNTHPGGRTKSGSMGSTTRASGSVGPGSRGGIPVVSAGAPASSFTVYNEEDSFSETTDGFLDWETVLVNFRAGWKIWLMSLFFVCAMTSKNVAMALWLNKLLPSFKDHPDHQLSTYLPPFSLPSPSLTSSRSLLLLLHFLLLFTWPWLGG